MRECTSTLRWRYSELTELNLSSLVLNYYFAIVRSQSSRVFLGCLCTICWTFQIYLSVRVLVLHLSLFDRVLPESVALNGVIWIKCMLVLGALALKRGSWRCWWSALCLKKRPCVCMYECPWYLWFSHCAVHQTRVSWRSLRKAFIEK